jgi:hypothetical protein
MCSSASTYNKDRKLIELGRNNSKKGQTIKCINKHIKPWEIWQCVLILIVLVAGTAPGHVAAAPAPAALAVVAVAHLAIPKQYP